MAKILISPSKYLQGAGEMKKIGTYASNCGKKALVLISKGGYKRIGKMIEDSFAESTCEVVFDYFNGECCNSEIDRLVNIVKENQCDLVIGIGGGKIFDTAKAVAYYAGTPVFICPTIASTDAPCSALSVVYTEEGIFEKYLFLPANPNVVLMDTDMICDARFSKCCGGVTEKFENCWEPVPHSYLTALRDGETPAYPDLTDEREAEQWIRTSPEAFCNTTDKEILSQVLNNYDQETTDFYRWKVEYTQDELSALILKRSGIDYGQIIDLVPVARGTSGRLWKLKIVGTKKTLTIGKELEIRRTLSPSHLYSSAFVVDRAEVSEAGIPGRFILTGAGWGHGAGLCQIGAAVMGEQGYKYDEILLHYYIGASIDQLYD